MMRLEGHVVSIGKKRNTYRILLGKLEGKRPLGRSRRKKVDNIKTDLIKLEWCSMVEINLAQDRDRWKSLVNTVGNLRVP
jgi:hypothetical protein